MEYPDKILHLFQTGVLLESYETISKVTLDVAIVQHHNNSRVRDLPTTDLGSVLCYIKRLLVTTDIRPSVTTHTVTLEHKNIEQMVPYTCQTLKDAFHVLRQVKSDILETFYSRFRWIFKSFSNEFNMLWSTETIYSIVGDNFITMILKTENAWIAQCIVLNLFLN